MLRIYAGERSPDLTEKEFRGLFAERGRALDGSRAGHGSGVGFMEGGPRGPAPRSAR